VTAMRSSGGVLLAAAMVIAVLAAPARASTVTDRNEPATDA
jgi:hypothetical protein